MMRSCNLFDYKYELDEPRIMSKGIIRIKHLLLNHPAVNMEILRDENQFCSVIVMICAFIDPHRSKMNNLKRKKIIIIHQFRHSFCPSTCQSHK